MIYLRRALQLPMVGHLNGRGADLLRTDHFRSREDLRAGHSMRSTHSRLVMETRHG